MQIGELKGKKLLEIGCGYSLFLAICQKNGINAVGIEPATSEFYQHTLKISKEILKRAGVDQNIVKQGVGENSPFKRNTFDAVVSLYILEHVQNVEKVIKESLRVLKPGGYIYDRSKLRFFLGRSLRNSLDSLFAKNLSKIICETLG